MKKVLNIILCILLMFMMTIESMAAGTPEICINVAETENTVNVEVVMKNNPGIVSMIVNVDYDAEKFTLAGVEDGGILGISMHSNNYSIAPYQLTWINGTAKNNFMSDGVIATLKFEKNNTSADVVSFKAECVEAYNVDLDAVEFLKPTEDEKSDGDLNENVSKPIVPENIVKPVVPEYVNPFEDVKEGDYFFDAVKWAVENDITTGTTETTFEPDMVCTRAQAVTFLYRAAGSPAVNGKGMPFVDVPENAYYYDAVIWAVENGITKGISETEFAPDMICSREQIVTFLHRTAIDMDKDVSVGEDTNILSYDDALEVGEWAIPAVQWAVGDSVMTGTSESTLAPKMDCSRAQIVTFLYRSMANE